MTVLKSILEAYTSAAHKVEGNHVTFENLTIPQYEEMNTQATQVKEYRDMVIAGTATQLGEVAKVQFKEEPKLDYLSTAVQYGGVQHDVTIHREFAAPVGDEVKTMPMHVVVVSNDNYGEELTKVRDALHEVSLVEEELNEE